MRFRRQYVQPVNRAILTALVFLVMSMTVSPLVVLSTHNDIPKEKGFDDDTHILVADNQLMAMEAFWASEFEIRASDDWGTFNMDLAEVLPSEDMTLRWVFDGVFHIIAVNEAYMANGWWGPLGYSNNTLYAIISSIAEQVRPPGTHYALGMSYNKTLVIFVSDILLGPEFLPEERWEITHDYSGGTQDSRLGWLPYEAKVRFAIWNAQTG